MDCEQATERLLEHLDDALSITEAGELTRHLAACTACSAEFEGRRVLRDRLAALPKPIPRPGVLDRMLTLAVSPRPATRLDSAWFVRLVRAPYLAAVLLVTIGIGIGIEVGHQRLAGPDVKLAARTIEVGPTVQQVGLLFNASEVLADASISVELPESIEIAGRPDVHRLSWRAYLKRGPNLLELPLVATGSGHGTLVVRVAQGSLVRTLEVPVTSQSSRPRAAVTVLGSAPVSS